MSKKDKDIALFVAFCIEEYGASKGMTGKQVLDLFSQYGVTDYLSKCFEPLHTQGRQWLIEEIDEYIGIREKSHEDISRQFGGGRASDDTQVQP
ncbi:MAG: DUF3791 domain-containing protein [Bacteroidales bacterium]|jgi:hypothetical protein|nr:DUF3791 domain-containing protein [Bacteroidales bacterium]